MSRSRGMFAAVVLATTFLAGISGSRHEAGAAPAAATAAAACCYSNQRYSGVCTVEPGEGETCASILAYLNDPNSQGKSYCGSTSIRRGWKQVGCAKPKQEAR